MIEGLRNWNDQVYQSMQSNLLLNPTFASAEKLRQLQLDESAQVLGLSDEVRLKILNSNTGDGASFHSIRALQTGQFRAKTWSKGSSVSKVPAKSRSVDYGYVGDELVIVEYRRYVNASPANAEQKVKRLSSLLQEATSPAFHIAPFVGYVHQPLHSRYGLVFRSPSIYAKDDGGYHTSLYDEFARTKWVPSQSPLRHRCCAGSYSFGLTCGWMVAQELLQREHPSCSPPQQTPPKKLLAAERCRLPTSLSPACSASI